MELYDNHYFCKSINRLVLIFWFAQSEINFTYGTHKKIYYRTSSPLFFSPKRPFYARFTKCEGTEKKTD